MIWRRSSGLRISQNSQGWRECIGLIVGRISDDEIEVVEIVPISSGTSVFVDITDWEYVFSLISEEKIDEGEVIVGWAHTHPGLGIFFSGTDIETQLIYQKMHPKSFGLVLDPTKVKTDFSGFNIYRVDINTSNPYTVDYMFTEHVNFKSIHEHLTSNLYGVPIKISDTSPVLVERNSVVWKDIIFSIKEPPLVHINKIFYVKIEIILPFRQFVRVEYELSAKLDGLPVQTEFELERFHFHETISSGFLSLYSFKLGTRNELSFELRNIRIADHTHKFTDLPNLNLNLKLN